jgi:hypothetical protein
MLKTTELDAESRIPASPAQTLAATPDLSAAEISTSRVKDQGSGKVTIGGKAENFDFKTFVVEGVLNVAVKAESWASELFGAAAVLLSRLSSNPKTAAAVGAAAALAASSNEAFGNQQPSGANDLSYIQYGQQLLTNMPSPTVWVMGVDQTGTQKYASGIFWDSYHIVTAGHVKIDIGFTNTILQVGIGKNSLSNDCQVANVANVALHPSWNFTHEGESLDVAVLTLDRPIAGTNAVVVTPVVGSFGSGSGFGRVMTPLSGDQPFDGNIRGWTTRIRRIGSADGSFSVNYAGADFSGFNDGPLPGGLWHGDSGGGLCNSSGQMLGMNVAFQGSTTYALRMDVAKPWIDSIIASELPQILAVNREGSDLRIRWRAASGVSYAVQASSSVGVPSDFVDISNPIALTNPGSGTLEYIDQGALTNSPTRFYRIRKIQN